MTILAIVAICVILAVLGFLLPRPSRGPQRGVDSTLGTGQRAGALALPARAPPAHEVPGAPADRERHDDHEDQRRGPGGHDPVDVDLVEIEDGEEGDEGAYGERRGQPRAILRAALLEPSIAPIRHSLSVPAGWDPPGSRCGSRDPS